MHTTGPPPQWLQNAAAEIQLKHPTAKFQVVPRQIMIDETPNTLHWRMQCLDCPGKIFHTGPEESLDNYEVHLKNRSHLMRVSDRLVGEPIA